MTTPRGERPRHPRVLIFEDDPAFRMVLVEFFAAEGFDVATCDSYAQLHQAVRSPERQIVLADFWGTSHAELSQAERDQVRDVARYAPMILLTGRSWAARVSARDLGVVCVVSKPLMLDALMAEVLGCSYGVAASE